MIMFGSFLASLGRWHYQVYSGRGSRRFHESTGSTSATRKGLTVAESNILLRGGLVRTSQQRRMFYVRAVSEPIPFQMGLQISCCVRSQKATPSALRAD